MDLPTSFPVLPAVRHQPAADLTRKEAAAIGTLMHHCFPAPAIGVEERIQRAVAKCADSDREVFTVWRAGRLLAHAAIFPREIRTRAGPLRVMALAAVGSDPGRRGQGWGRTVTLAAFHQVDTGRFSVALFQTDIPEFYEKLGARTVANRFINSRFQPHSPGAKSVPGTQDAPWWTSHVMIYPRGYSWPHGTIDLQGTGY